MRNAPDELALPGPGSLTWRYFGQLIGLLTAGTGLLLQVAHPVVGAGVAEHSTFREAPWPRLVNTHVSTMELVYGGRERALAEGARLWAMHREISGTDAHGRRYSALQPEAYAWVHLTLWHFMVNTRALFGTPLGREECERLWAEMREVGRALGIRELDLPRSAGEAQQLIDHTVAEVLEANQATVDVLDSLRHPVKPFDACPDLLWKLIAVPGGRLVELATIGGIPAALRARLGLSWSAADERRLRRFGTVVRTVNRLTPPPLRYAPMADIAFATAWADQQRARLLTILRSARILGP